MDTENTKSQNSSKFLGIIVIIAVLGLGYFLLSNNAKTNQEMTQPSMEKNEVEDSMEVKEETTEAEDAMVKDDVAEEAMVEDANSKTFTVTGSNFMYDVKEIKVNKGDTVKIIFKNASGVHDWKLDEFSVNTNVLNGGQEETVTFVADKVGTFEYYCSVGKHREMGMKGNLIVM
ncbi:cupredoxin domain-containing protein [Patescibacteria group bacterium]|nr:cupredoxin domain-containing protein [Patescibacteria group bacterium]